MYADLRNCTICAEEAAERRREYWRPKNVTPADVQAAKDRAARAERERERWDKWGVVYILGFIVVVFALALLLG